MLNSGMIKRRKTIKLVGVEPTVAEKAVSAFSGRENLSIERKKVGEELHLLITAKAETEEEAKSLLKSVAKELKQSFSENLPHNKEAETLEQVLVKLLEKNELTLSTAESCTGGLLAGRLINVPGVSDVFKEGFITYTNKSKKKRLDVSKSTLKKHGAVSKQTAKEMAMGTALNTDSDTAIAITGIAGPDGGSEEKPLGLVYIAVYLKGEITVEEYHFKGGRQEVREQAVESAILLLIKYLNEKY